MPKNADSQVRAKVWVTPEQVDAMRTATLRDSASYLAERNEAMIALMYDTGVRVGELVALNVEHLRNDNRDLYLPTAVQKDFPNENSPPPKTLELASDTSRVLTKYLDDRWKDPDALFPSRSAIVSLLRESGMSLRPRRTVRTYGCLNSTARVEYPKTSAPTRYVMESPTA
jgi:integrase/recombinase XerC/integrase/recombinase XerD